MPTDVQKIGRTLGELVHSLRVTLKEIDQVVGDLDIPLEHDPVNQAAAFLGRLGMGEDIKFEEPTIPVVAPLSTPILADAYALVERHNQRVCVVLLSAQEFTDLRKYSPNHIETERRVRVLRRGVMGYLWGAYLMVDSNVPKGTVYVMGEVLDDPKITPACSRVTVTRG